MVTNLRCFLLFAAVIMEASATSVLSVNQSNHASMSETYKDPRFLFKFITIDPFECFNAAATEKGQCYTAKDCSKDGGTSDSKCASGLGVCCFINLKCDQTFSTTSANFVNPSYPSPDTGPLQCNLNVMLASKNICQLKYEFITFELGQPDVDGRCEDDFMNIRGTTNDKIVPTLCGLNSGQHMYVDVDPTTTTGIKTTIDLVGFADNQRWKIKITQIACDSPERAPTGCRQYFTTPSAIVRSFNYKQPNANDFVPGALQPNLHLADLDYKICIKPEPDYCSISWTVFPRENRYSFIMTQDPLANNAVLGDPAVIQDPFDPNGACNDYVLIPGGDLADRHCGLSFPKTVTSSAQPFSMHVRTNDLEQHDLPNVDLFNTGFSLMYRETACR